MSIDVSELAALAAQAGERSVQKGGEKLDHQLACRTIIHHWIAGDIVTSSLIAKTTAAEHGVRLYLGLGCAGKGGLLLDQGELVTLQIEGDGAKPRSRPSFPPTRRNWAKVLVALGLGDTCDMSDLAALLGVDEDDLTATIEAAG
jgi:hypothetical protein